MALISEAFLDGKSIFAVLPSEETSETFAEDDAVLPPVTMVTIISWPETHFEGMTSEVGSWKEHVKATPDCSGLGSSEPLQPVSAKMAKRGNIIVFNFFISFLDDSKANLLRKE